MEEVEEEVVVVVEEKKGERMGVEEEEEDALCTWGINKFYLNLNKEGFLAKVKDGPIKKLLRETIVDWPNEYFSTQLALHPCTNDLCGLLAIALEQKGARTMTLESVLDRVDALVSFGNKEGRRTFRFSNSSKPWDNESHVGQRLARFFSNKDFKQRFGNLNLEDIQETAAKISDDFKIWHKVAEWFEHKILHVVAQCLDAVLFFSTASNGQGPCARGWLRRWQTWTWRCRKASPKRM